MYENITLESVIFEITLSCNLDCTHCFNRKSNRNENMNFEDIKKFTDEFIQYGSKEIIISGGEPFLHPDIEKIIMLAKNYPEIKFEITTNGFLLTKEILDFISQYENIGVQISIDGSNKEIYELSRGEHSYDNYLEGLRLLAESKIKNKKSRTAVTKFNYKDVSEIYKVSIENKILPSFVFVTKSGNAEDNWDTLALNIAGKMNVVNQIKLMNKKYGLELSSPTPVNDCSFSYYQERRYLLIKPNGDVVVCQWLYDFPVGNIFKTTLENILKGEIMNKYYEEGSMRYKQLSNHAACLKCEIKNKCNFGCYGMALVEGNSYGFDGECSYRKAHAICETNNLF